MSPVHFRQYFGLSSYDSRISPPPSASALSQLRGFIFIICDVLLIYFNFILFSCAFYLFEYVCAYFNHYLFIVLKKTKCRFYRTSSAVSFIFCLGSNAVSFDIHQLSFCSKFKPSKFAASSSCCSQGRIESFT